MAPKTKARKAPRKASSVETKSISLAAIPSQVGRMKVTVRGTSPLIMHAQSKKLRTALLDTQTDSKRKRNKIQPVLDAVECLYPLNGDIEEITRLIPDNYLLLTAEQVMDPVPLPFLDGISVGMPATAFKKGMGRAAIANGRKIVDIKTQIRVESIIDSSFPLVEVHYDEPPYMRCDPASIGTGKSNVMRFRPCFPSWSASFIIKYHKGVKALTREIVLGLLADAGEFIGVGDWRGEKDGIFGFYAISGVEI